MKAYPKKTKFCAWGYGVTGRPLVHVLNERGYVVVVVEDRKESEFPRFAEEIASLRNAGVEFHFGGIADFPKFLKSNIDVLSPSPGIKIPADVIDACEQAHITIAGEIEIASRLVQGKIIAVTGTDGKTTTTTLIHHILTLAGFTSHLAGNVGFPLIELAGKTKPDHWLALEVSSYQLETVRRFRPYIAVLLNIAEDHIERHGDMRTYIRMKSRIFDNQRETDHAVVNFDDPLSLQAFGQAVSILHGFSLAGPIPKGAWRLDGALMSDEPEGAKEVVNTSELQLLGDHNHSNMLAAILACRLAGVSIEAIGLAAKEFRSLPHRIEKIGEIDGVEWINDSKATNVHSTISALKVFDRPIVLLLGGYEKGLDLTDLIPLINRHVKHVILLGATRNRFRKELRESGYTAITLRKTLQEACLAAQGIALPGDIVLLSPASSSFDQFRDFVDRGETFRKWVEKKMEKKES
jgi:UDP-N-acetylmuramoylalanine--D-glutamate ligase